MQLLIKRADIYILPVSGRDHVCLLTDRVDPFGDPLILDFKAPRHKAKEYMDLQFNGLPCTVHDYGNREPYKFSRSPVDSLDETSRSHDVDSSRKQ